MSRNICGYTPPKISYDNICVNNVSYSLGDNINVSFVPPYNTVRITLTSDTTLNRFVVNCTYEDEEYDIDKGVSLLREPGTEKNSLPKDTSLTFIFEINNTTFNRGDGAYRVGLYAQSAVNYSWDVTYILFTVGGTEMFVPSDATSFEVLTTKTI